MEIASSSSNDHTRASRKTGRTATSQDFDGEDERRPPKLRKKGGDEDEDEDFLFLFQLSRETYSDVEDGNDVIPNSQRSKRRWRVEMEEDESGKEDSKTKGKQDGDEVRAIKVQCNCQQDKKPLHRRPCCTCSL